MWIVLRKKRKGVPSWWPKPRPKRRRRRRRTWRSSNAPLVKLFRHKAMAAVAYDAVLMKTDIFLSAKELLSKLEGFIVNNDCSKGASEFHERVRIAWQEEDFAGAVWRSWSQNPAVIEGLRGFSKTCAAEERVAAMKKDPFVLDILKASKSAKDAKAKNYVMLRGLLSILFVYWNDGDDLENLFVAGDIMVDLSVDDDLPLPEFPYRKPECVSFVAQHPDDLLVLKTLLKSKHGDDPDFVDQIFAEASGVLVPNLCRERRRIEVHYDSLGASVFLFFPDPKLE